MSERKIALLVPELPGAEELVPFLRRIDAAHWYTNFGQLVRELEGELAAFSGAAAVATVANCTLGLELALTALGLPRGSRVLIPSLTFVATASAVLRAGLQPVVADVDSESWVLTPRLARAALASVAVDCVMPVATFGCAQDAPAWDGFSEQSSLPVVIDAAGAFGNQAIGRRTITAVSLHATKSLASGEGGFVASGDPGLVEKIRRLTNFGIDSATGIVEMAGTNAKLSEYHAAVGLAALKRWPAQADARRRLASCYRAALLHHCPDVVLQSRPAEGVYSIFPVCLPAGADVKRIATALARGGIETRRWYFPLIHQHPAFENAVRADAMQNASRLSGRIISLPFHLHLAEEQIESVCVALRDALAG